MLVASCETAAGIGQALGFGLIFIPGGEGKKWVLSVLLCGVSRGRELGGSNVWAGRFSSLLALQLQ